MQQTLAPWAVGTPAGGEIHPCCPGKTCRAVKEDRYSLLNINIKPFEHGKRV